MHIELLAFANFQFEIIQTTTKVIVGERVKDETRYRLNWSEYTDYLTEQGLDMEGEDRSFFDRYRMPKPDEQYFHQFIGFQGEIQELLTEISEKRVIHHETWESIFREAERVGEIVTPNPPVTGDIREEDLNQLTFERNITAETYRSLLFGQLRDLIVSRKVFRLRKCPECGTFFMDGTRNGKKVYCSSSTCGNRAKQRTFQKKKKNDIDPAQSRLKFDENNADRSYSSSNQTAFSTTLKEVL